MGTFGNQLRETREARGLSLDAVADATRIAPRHLAALERSDVQALPAGPFAKGYIEAYSQLLGIDPDPVLEAYRAEGQMRGLGTPEAQDRIVEEYSRILEHRSARRAPGWLPGKRGLALVLLGMGILGTGAWLLSRNSTPRSALAPTPPPAGPEKLGSAGMPEEPVTPEGPRPETPRREARAVPEEVPGPSEPPSPDPAAPATAPAAVPPVPDPATSPAVGELEVSHSGVGTGVENNRLVGRSDRFTEGSPVVFWTRVLGGRPGEAIHHEWFHEGQRVTLAPLTLGGTHWRTHSRRLLDPGLTGQWVVAARRPGGEVLARHEFLCIPADR